MHKYLKNQNGMVTAISLIALSFFIIVLAGSMIYSENEVNNTTKARDMSQAQFLAEAGIKRAIANFNLNQNGVWNWVDNTTTPTNWQTATNTSTEQYHVKISLSSDVTNQAIVPTIPPANSTYLVTSVGRCNGIQKTMSALVSVNLSNSLNSEMFKYGIFGGTGVELYGSDTIKADFGSNGYWSASGAKVNGTYTITSNTSTTSQNWTKLPQNITWPFGSITDLENKLQNPARPLLTKADPLNPTQQISVSTAADLIPILQKNPNLENCTIILTSSFGMDDNFMSQIQNVQFKNVSLFVNGDFILNTKKQVNVNDNCLIVATGKIYLTGNNVGGGVYVSYGDFDIHSANMNAGAFYAQNTVRIWDSNISQSQTAITVNGFSPTPANAPTGVTTTNWTIYSY